MKIRIKRLDKNIPLPDFKTADAAGFDLSAREEVVIQPNQIGYIPLNVVIEIPSDYVLFIFPRSSTHKKGLIMANSVGVIDPDFCGDEDEIKSAYYNYTDKPVVIVKGERIAQGIIQSRIDFGWEETDKMNNSNRGAFGTTGQ